MVWAGKMAECFSFSQSAKDRIQVERPLETSDNFGGRAVAWRNAGSFWAMITPATGREIFAQQADQSRVTHKMLIRYQADFKDITKISDHRIKFDDRLFGIKTIRNLDADMKRHGNVYQEFLVEENAPDIQG